MFKITRETYGTQFPLLFFSWIFLSHLGKRKEVGGMKNVLFPSPLFFFIRLYQNSLFPFISSALH